LKIELEGHHVDITDGMRSIAEKKLKKFEKRFDRIGAIHVTVKVERNEQQIEAKTNYLGDVVCVSASDKDFYKAIDSAATKLGKSLESRKGHIDVKGRGKPPIIDPDASNADLDEDDEFEPYQPEEN
jgi:putative sigma-54 modulation protein